MKEEIKTFIDEAINKNSLVKINEKLYLKRYQIEVLEYYGIEYKACSSVSEILFFIEEILENGEVENEEQLEEVASSLQEFQYYHNTNK